MNSTLIILFDNLGLSDSGLFWKYYWKINFCFFPRSEICV